MSDVSGAESSTNGEGSSRGALGGEGKVIDTGKVKFGMDLQFVSHHQRASSLRGQSLMSFSLPMANHWLYQLRLGIL